MKRSFPLTPEQLKLLEAWADGLRPDMQAAYLGISRTALKRRQERLVRHMHARNRAHAVAEALRREVIE